MVPTLPEGQVPSGMNTTQIYTYHPGLKQLQYKLRLSKLGLLSLEK